MQGLVLSFHRVAPRDQTHILVAGPFPGRPSHWPTFEIQNKVLFLQRGLGRAILELRTAVQQTITLSASGAVSQENSTQYKQATDLQTGQVTSTLQTAGKRLPWNDTLD